MTDAVAGLEDYAAGCEIRVRNESRRFFQSILVRSNDKISMNRKISTRPRVAVGIPTARFGSSEKRP